MNRLYSFRIALATWILAIATSPMAVASTEDDALKKYEEARAALESQLSSPIHCVDPVAGAQKASCQFKDLCKMLAKNAKGQNLYENRKGQVIPNYYLRYAVEDAIKSCWQTAHLGKDWEDTVKEGKKQNIERKKAERALYKTLSAKGDQDKYLKIQRSQIDQSLMKAESNSKDDSTDNSTSSNCFDLNDCTAKVKKLEKQGHVKLSNESRAAWAKCLFLYSSRHLVRDPEQKSIIRNPFINTRLMVDTVDAGGVDAVKKNQADYQKEIDRAHVLFQDSQAKIVERLERQRTPENTKQIDGMIQRIKTISFNGLDLSYALAPPRNALVLFSQCPGPNAFYDPSNHSFTLCPQVLQLPDASLQAIIAHELSHSIDPCTISSDLISASGVANAPFARNAIPRDGKTDDQLLASQGLLTYRVKIQEQPFEKADYRIDESGIIDDALKIKFSSYTKSTVAKSCPRDLNPFDSVINCLTTPESVGARTPTEAEATQLIDTEIARQNAAGAKEDSPSMGALKNTRANIPKLLRDKGGCANVAVGSKGKSQLQEAFADWMSAEVMGSKIDSLPANERSTAAFEISGFFLSLGCTEARDLALDEGKNARKAMGCKESDQNQKDLETIQRANYMQEDEHPLEANRIEKLFLMNPAVRQALGCEPASGVRHCE